MTIGLSYEVWGRNKEPAQPSVLSSVFREDLNMRHPVYRPRRIREQEHLRRMVRET